VFDNVAITKQKGLQAELYVAHLLVRHGFTVLMPYGEDVRYDLVSEKNGVFKRIQVKHVTPRGGVLEVQLRSSNNYQVIRYTPADVDVVAAFNPEDCKVYFIPLSEILNRNCLKLRLTGCKNNQRRRVVWAADFESRFDILEKDSAGVAQLVEHLICNQRAGGSSPSAGSVRF
jgi:PD-(D/E)XK endonuclease